MTLPGVGRGLALALLVTGATAGIATGCTRLAGPLEVDAPDTGAGSASPAQLEGGAPLDATAPTDEGDEQDGATLVCSPGQFQCAGPELQVCNPTRDGWVNEQLCGSAALCDAASGTCAPPRPASAATCAVRAPLSRRATPTSTGG